MCANPGLRNGKSRKFHPIESFSPNALEIGGSGVCAADGSFDS
jgi:hypothetical protein